MSFTCGTCQTAQPCRTKPHRVISEMRGKEYPERKEHDHKFTEEEIEELERKREGRKRGKVIDKGGRGTEAVNELDLCTDCYVSTKKEQILSNG